MVKATQKQNDDDNIWHLRLPAEFLTGGALARLSGGCVKVMLALVLHADEKGRCWPSLATISELSGLTRSATCRALTKLEKSKVVKRLARGGGRSQGGKYPSTTYKLAVTGSTPLSEFSSDQIDGLAVTETPFSSVPEDTRTAPVEQHQVTAVAEKQKPAAAAVANSPEPNQAVIGKLADLGIGEPM